MGKSRESTIGIDSPASRGIVVTDPATGLPVGEVNPTNPTKIKSAIVEAVPAKSETTTSAKKPRAKPSARQKAGINKNFLGKKKD